MSNIKFIMSVKKNILIHPTMYYYLFIYFLGGS